MWISKKKFNELEKRIADLEGQQTANTFSYGEVGLKKLAKIVENKNKKADLEGQVQSQQDIQNDLGVIQISTYLPNSFLSRTQVSFQLSAHDWYLLEQSKGWKAVEGFLEECQKQNNPTIRKAKLD